MRKVSKLILFILLGLVIILAGYESYENKIEIITQRVIALSKFETFDNKFSLNLQVNYLNIFPIGEASYYLKGFSQYEGKPVYQLEMVAEDIFPFSWLKPAKAKMVSYLDTSEMLPVYLFTQIEVDGELKEKKEITYYQTQGYMLSEGKQYLILYPTYEPLSLIFYLMQTEFDLHKDEVLNLNSNQANYNVKIEVKNKKEYKVKGEIYRVWEVNLSVKRRKGDVMRHSLDAKLYFLNMKNINIPLLGKAYTNLGNISLRLKKIGKFLD